MKSKRLRRLQTWTIIVLFFYLLMLGNFFVNIYKGATKWGPAYAERRIESDKTVQELQIDFRDALQNTSRTRHVEGQLLLIYFGANVAMIGFLGWSTFMIFRIKREVDHVVLFHI
jgi:hypothetical protein